MLLSNDEPVLDEEQPIDNEQVVERSTTHLGQDDHHRLLQSPMHMVGEEQSAGPSIPNEEEVVAEDDRTGGHAADHQSTASDVHEEQDALPQTQEEGEEREDEEVMDDEGFGPHNGVLLWHAKFTCFLLHCCV